MRVWLQCFTIGLLFMISPPTFGQDVRSHRVLFLGNSVFYYGGGLYQSFEGFCQADGLDYQAVSQLLQPDNPHGIEFLDFGRIPLNLPEIAANDQIHSLIRSSRFDYVILEARRLGYLLPAWVELPDNFGQHIPYEQNVAALGKIHRTIVESGAQTVLYMHPYSHRLPDLKHPVAQIYERLRTDLENMEINGERHNVTLVPASLLWLDALNRYKLEDWYAGGSHGTALARYASGCMLFTYLTDKDPRKNDFRELPLFWQISSQKPSDYVSEEDAKWIKDQVWLYYSTRPHGHHGEEGEESGTELALSETYDEVRNGARLILAYDAKSNSFNGTVENTTDKTLKQVRVEVHLSNGKELGPTTPGDLKPGQRRDVKLRATSKDFDGWTAHPEVGSGEHGHDEGHGEHDR